MIRLQINNSYQDLLAANQLGSYSSLMHTEAGTVIEQNEQRDVRRLILGEQCFYLKRVNCEKITSAFESYLAGKAAHSKPFKEMLHYGFLRDRGFDVAEVVAVGEQLKLGIPNAGFIMTKEVPGQDLSRVFQVADQETRLSIMRRFGALVGNLHNYGFFGSIRLKDIICSGEPAEAMTMTLIDREVRNPYPRRTTKQKVLKRLLINVRRQTSQGEVFSPKEWKIFTKYYCRNLSQTVRIDKKSTRDEIGQILLKATRGGAE